MGSMPDDTGNDTEVQWGWSPYGGLERSTTLAPETEPSTATLDAEAELTTTAPSC